MKYMYLMPLFAILVAVLYSSCTAKKHLPTEYKKKQLIFGTGGGFTGAVTTYVLQENGQLFQTVSDTSYKEVSVLSKDSTKTYFAQMDTIPISDSLEFTHPGNMYYFLEKKEGYADEKSNRITWGDGKHEPPAGIKELHTSLIQIVRDLNNPRQNNNTESK